MMIYIYYCTLPYIDAADTLMPRAELLRFDYFSSLAFFRHAAFACHIDIYICCCFDYDDDFAAYAFFSLLR